MLKKGIHLVPGARIKGWEKQSGRRMLFYGRRSFRRGQILLSCVSAYLYDSKYDKFMLLLAWYIYDGDPDPCCGHGHSSRADARHVPLSITQMTSGDQMVAVAICYVLSTVNHFKIFNANHRVTPDLGWTDTVTFRHRVEVCPRPQHRVPDHRRIFRTRLRGSCKRIAGDFCFDVEEIKEMTKTGHASSQPIGG